MRGTSTWVMSVAKLCLAITSQPGRARLAGVSRWVSRQIKRWCSDGAARAGPATARAAPLTKNARRDDVMARSQRTYRRTNLGDSRPYQPAPPCSKWPDW